MNVYVDIAERALLLVIMLSIFPLAASLIVGLLISFFQALTQIQEQTLTFVPKIIITILVIILTSGLMLNALINFTTEIFGLMQQVGK